MVLLALLAGLGYAYWHFTNDARVTAEAQKYLQSMLIGGRVKVQRAHFSPLRGIELHKVSLYLSDRDTEPFFTARNIELKHKPWSLLRGRLEAAAIFCDRPSITFDQDNFQRFLKLVKTTQSDTAAAGGGPLPLVQIDRCTLKFVQARGSLRSTDVKTVDISMIPRTPSYLIQFREILPQGEPIEGVVEVNLASGESKTMSGKLPIEYTVAALPAKYVQWCSRYDLKGSFRFHGKPSTKGSVGDWQFEFFDASLKLPEAQGGLNLEHAVGTITMNEGGIDVQNVKCQVRQAGKGWYELNGRYDGFSERSPFRLELTASEVTLPDWREVTGQLGRNLERFEEYCRPRGSFALRATIARNKDGKIAFAGSAKPLGMSMTIEWFPYRMENIRQESVRVGGVRPGIKFDARGVQWSGIAASHGKASISCEGRLSLADKGTPFDMTFKAKGVRLDGDMRSALPSSVHKIWDSLSPSGATGLRAHISRTLGQHGQTVDVTLDPGGDAAICYDQFPYPLDGIKARQLRILGRDVFLGGVTGQQGSARCTVNGSILGIGTPQQRVDLDVTATRIGLDEVLLEAIGPGGRSILSNLELDGIIASLTAKVTQAPGARLEYAVEAMIQDTQITAKDFRYPLDDCKGLLKITPAMVTIDGITGRHGDCSATVSGQVMLGQKQLGLDLTLDATAMAMDEELYGALPPGVQRTWKRLSPSGQADVKLHYRRNLSDVPDMDYELTFKPQGMAVRYEDFPFTFRNVRGTVMARPGRIELKEMTASDGKMRASLAGTIVYDDRHDEVDLAVKASEVPVTPTLLQAMPRDLASLAAGFKAAGTCGVDLTSLHIARTHAPAAASMPATSPGKSAPATAKAPEIAWRYAGSMTFDKAVISFGKDDQTFSGKLEGSAARTKQGLELKAQASLDSIRQGDQEVTDLSCEIDKKARSPLIHVQELSARAYGGMLAGVAEIRLAKQLEYAVRLDVEGVDLQQLVNARIKDPNEQAKVVGKLAGRLEYSATPGRKPARQAAGQLWITKAKMGKLPVLLDMMNVLYFTLPGQSPFTEGDLTYVLKDDTLTLQEMYFAGSRLSMLGSGTMNMKTQRLNLTFLTGPPGKVPRIKVISELFDQISASISEIRVTGTLTKPMFKNVPFRNVDRLLRPEK